MIADVPRLGRRSVVAVAAAVVSAGCSGGTGQQRLDGAGHGTAAPEPGAVVRQQAAHDSAGLLAQYDAAAAAHPALAARLRPLRAEVALHVAAFGGRPAPAPTATTTPAPPPPTPSPTPAAALASLATAEQRLADHRAAALLDVPGELARLLASVAAAGAGHVALLAAKAGTGAGR